MKNSDSDSEDRINKILKLRVEKLQQDMEIFENKVPKALKKKGGAKGYKVAYICLSIQRTAITKDKTISLPSLKVLSIAFNVTTKHVARIINKLIESGSLSLKEYHKINDVTGEVETYEVSINGDKRSFLKTTGRLRKVINPFSKLKKYIQSKVSEKQEMAKLKIKDGGIQFVKRFIDLHRLDYDKLDKNKITTKVSTSPKTSGDDIDLEL